MKSFFNKIQTHQFWSLICVFGICTVLFYHFFIKADFRKQAVLKHDMLNYYSYLPAYFIEHDLKFEKIEKQPDKLKNYWFVKTKDGKNIQKMSIGMAYLYAPFFGIAHLFTKYVFIDKPLDGFSIYYQFFIGLSSIFYLFIGLFFLRLFLLKWFSDWAVTISLFLVVLSTNLQYYSTIEGPMSHTYSFSLVSIFLFLTLKICHNPHWKWYIIMGLVFGLIVLIRPTNFIIILFPIVYIYLNHSRFFSFVSKHALKILLSVLMMLLVFLPQFLYWKWITGHFIYYSYGENERFFFNNPMIYESLLGFRKGLLIYSPILIFGILGLLFSNSILKKGSLMVLLPFLYISSSWWCWWYGGSFGLRSCIDVFPFFAIGLAAFVEIILSKQIIYQLVFVCIAYVFYQHNQFQIAQYQLALLHWDAMNYKTWKAIQGSLDYPQDYDKLISPPNYEAAMKGIR